MLLYLQSWRDTYNKAATSLTDRENKVDEAANFIETKLKLLGATAIEDQLQDEVNLLNYLLLLSDKVKNLSINIFILINQVPETIQSFLQADINVWVLTGDKQETAINIGYSCRLITQSMPLIIINENSLDVIIINIF